MRLTIIPNDKAVYKDTVAYSPLNTSVVPTNVHALQWFGNNGWIEFNDGTANQDITELPDWTNICLEEWEKADYAEKHPPPPTAELNKQIAVNLLKQTDWSALGEIADPAKSNPYLVNANEFNEYRNAVRQIAINPVAGDLVWPVTPKAKWANSN